MTAELPITPEQRSNLEKLATLLERVVPPPEFDMSNYAYLDSGLTTELASKYTEGFDLDEVDMTIIDAAYDFDALEPALVKAHFSGEIDRHPVFMTQDVYSHCGTVACAAGHGPMAGIEAKPHESWTAYTDRVFGTKINGHFREGYVLVALDVRRRLDEDRQHAEGCGCPDQTVPGSRRASHLRTRFRGVHREVQPQFLHLGH